MRVSAARLASQDQARPQEAAQAARWEAVAARAAAELASAPAQDVIAWAVETFGDRLCITSSMTDAVIIHLAASVKPGLDVIFLAGRDPAGGYDQIVFVGRRGERIDQRSGAIGLDTEVGHGAADPAQQCRQHDPVGIVDRARWQRHTRLAHLISGRKQRYA